MSSNKKGTSTWTNHNDSLEKVAEKNELIKAKEACSDLTLDLEHGSAITKDPFKVQRKLPGQTSIDLSEERPPDPAELNQALTSDKKGLARWKEIFNKDADQACLKALTQERVLTHLQNELAEVQFKLKEAEDKFVVLSTTLGSLRYSEEQWKGEKTELHEKVERLQSVVVGKEREMAALQSEEVALVAIVKRMHEEEARMTEELGSVKEKLDFSEQIRVEGEQLYNQLMQDNEEDQNKIRFKLHKLISEVHEKDKTFSSVKMEMENALANLLEAEINMTQDNKNCQCNHEGKRRLKPLRLEVENAHLQVTQKQRQLEAMESEMTKMLAVLENRLQEAEAAWRKEKKEILLELNKARLDAAEKISEATEALRKFKDGQEIMKEAEFMVSALVRANKNAKMEKLSVISQWQVEKTYLAAELDRIRNALIHKEEEMLCREKEVQETLIEVKYVMDLAKNEIAAFMNVAELSIESYTSNLQDMREISEKLRLLLHLKEDIYKPVSEFTGQSEKGKTSALTNIATSLEQLNDAHRLELQVLHLQDALTSMQISFEESLESKKLTVNQLEEMSKMVSCLEIEKSKLTEKLGRKMNDSAIPQSDLQESRNITVEVRKSHSNTIKELQEKDAKSATLMTQLEDAQRKVHELENLILDMHVDRCEREVLIGNILEVTKKPAGEIMQALEHYERKFSVFLGKLEEMVARISDKAVAENMWIDFADKFELAMSKLEDNAKYSNAIWDRLENILAEKKLLEQELERKQELLKGSLFDLSLLQETTAESKDMKDEMHKTIVIIRSLQEELDARITQLKAIECKNLCLENDNEKKTKDLIVMDVSLSESQRYVASLERENAELKEEMEGTLMKCGLLEEKLEDKRHTIEELELELFEMNFLVEQKMIRSLESINQELSLVVNEKDQLYTELLLRNEQLEMTRSSAEKQKTLADEAQQIAEMSKSHAQEKEEEVKILERSIEELERTVNALESQMDIVRREAETQRIIKEDVEMELQALRHQMYNMHSAHTDTQQQQINELWGGNQRSVEMKKLQLLEAQKEIENLRRESEDKDAEIKSCKTQIEELITAAEKQAAAYHQKLTSLEAMVGEVNMEKGETGGLLLTPYEPGEKTAPPKSSSSPFKCMTSALAQQINFEIDEELYSNRRRIDELEDLASSRQKEIFRLNKRLAEAETMTYDVLRDLLGVKSDITSHASWLDQKQLQKISQAALQQTKAALQKEELDTLRARFANERESWLEDMNRRQAEVVAAHVAAEKLRQKDMMLKAENKRLKAELASQKKRLFELQDTINTSLGQKNYEHCAHSHLEIQLEDEDLETRLRRTETLLNHVNNELGRHRTPTMRRKRDSDR